MMGGMASMGPPHATLEMAVMGLDVAVVAPAVYLLTRRWVPWDRLGRLPAAAILLGYWMVHAAITIGMAYAMPPPLPDAGFHLVLIATSVVFWLPVVGRNRLSDAGQMAYLFIAMPALDLAGVWIVGQGDSGGGLAMIVGMLPLALWTLYVSWRWMSREEREAAQAGLPSTILAEDHRQMVTTDRAGA
jgi:cytochrome c oxidase assembly factor CtaG